MRLLVLEPSTSGFDAILEQRRLTGLDRLDEVWEGVHHMVPAPSGEHADVAQQLAEILGPPARAAGLVPALHEFNLGRSAEDYRVPDGGLHRRRPSGVWQASAALVVEILSPGDESWEKLPFFAAHGVEEVLLVDPVQRTVHWLGLRDGAYAPVAHSGLIALDAATLAARLDWPEA